MNRLTILFLITTMGLWGSTASAIGCVGLGKELNSIIGQINQGCKKGDFAYYKKVCRMMKSRVCFEGEGSKCTEKIRDGLHRLCKKGERTSSTFVKPRKTKKQKGGS